MFITLSAILVSLFIFFFSLIPLNFDPMHLAVLFGAGGTVIFLAIIFLKTFALMPFEYLEQKLIPNVMNLIQRDIPLRIGHVYLFLFVFISYISIPLISNIPDMDRQWAFLAWMILFGVALDFLHDHWRRYVNFLNPSFLVSHVYQQAKKAIRNDNREALLSDLNNLGEIGLHAVEKSKLALSTQALQTFPSLLKTYFDAAKSISHISTKIDTEKNEEGGDAANYVVFYLMQRLELINDKALRDRQETVCRQMIMTLGKIIVHSSQFDLSMVSFPTHFLTKFGLKAQQHYFDEVTVLTTSTLLEVSKTIVAEVDVTYADLQIAFQSIVHGLAAIARATFKKEKDTNIKVLVQPLVDVQTLFKSDKMAQYKDTPAILEQINTILDEFSVLQQVMQSMPTLSTMDSSEEQMPLS